MNRKQERVHQGIFDNPVRADLKWSDIESLLVALGATVTEGNGSRVRVKLNGIRAGFHRPHPARIAGKMLVRSVRDYLIEAGSEP